MNNKFIEKFTSGKFLFTLITAFVFAFLSVTGKLPMDKVHEIILIIVYAYFTKANNGNANGTNQHVEGSGK